MPSKTTRMKAGAASSFKNPPSLSEKLNRFSPTLLPPKGAPTSEETKERFSKSLSIGTKMDFALLSEENRLLWLKFFADTVVKLNTECTLLRGQLDQYRVRATNDVESKAKVDFVNKILPLLKSGMFSIFIRLIFPSTVEVTSSRDRRALLSFGLNENSPFASLVFDSIFKSLQGTTASSPVDIAEENLSPPPTLKFDTPEHREELWLDLGVGTFAVKTFNTSRNTYTNLIREVVSKFSFQDSFAKLLQFFTHFCII